MFTDMQIEGKLPKPWQAFQWIRLHQHFDEWFFTCINVLCGLPFMNVLNSTIIYLYLLHFKVVYAWFAELTKIKLWPKTEEIKQNSGLEHNFTRKFSCATNSMKFAFNWFIILFKMALNISWEQTYCLSPDCSIPW